MLERQNGPTILVGHSFSGMIGTEAGVHPNLSALVYMAARARCGRGLYRLSQDVSDAAGGGWHGQAMGAKTIEVKASHLSLISRPEEITRLIFEAAGQQA
jgi:hypothetical protein